MKIWIHRYELKPREVKLTARRGALVKVEWTPGQTGYSDVHPWPEFGEPTIDEHIASLKALKFTSLVENSLEYNFRDHEFRLQKRNAFLGLILPRSHRLVFDLEALDQNLLREWSKEGFSHIKVKMGRNLKVETEIFVQMAYATTLMWRVDFNGRVSETEFLEWWKKLDGAVKARIDYIEDPVRSAQLKIDGPWANDWTKQARAQIRIVKPAREGSEETAQYERIVFTHGLDHPIGQACSAWSAARFYGAHPRKTEVCGLAATDFFELNDFSREWYCEGPRMKPTSGTGFGFDELLKGLAWEQLL